MNLKCLLMYFALVALAAAEPATTPAATTFPLDHTITDSQGRKMDVTLTGKTENTVKFTRKSDGKEFEVELEKISEDDRKYVAGLKVPPTKKPSLLFIGQGNLSSNNLVIDKLKSAGFAVQCIYSQNVTMNGIGTMAWPGLEEMSDEQLKGFDVIWAAYAPRQRVLPYLPAAKAMVFNVPEKSALKEFLENREETSYNSSPYVKTDENLIRYNAQVITWESKTGSYKRGEIQAEIVDKVIVETQKLLTKPSTGSK